MYYVAHSIALFKCAQMDIQTEEIRKLQQQIYFNNLTMRTIETRLNILQTCTSRGVDQKLVDRILMEQREIDMQNSQLLGKINSLNKKLIKKSVRL